MSRSVIMVGVTVCLACGCVPSRAANCEQPQKFQSGAVVREDAVRIVANVSTAPENFTVQRLLCLAEQLRVKYSPGHEEVMISIFDDAKAATNKNLRAFTPEAREQDYEILQHEHASYIFKRGTAEDCLVLEPDPRNETTFRRLLLESAPSRCGIAIGQNRCLVIADHLQYPVDAWRSSDIGSVEIEAIVSKTGTITSAKVKEDQSAAQQLRDSALNDLRHWRFEPGEQESITVKYSYELEGSPDTYPRSIVRYDLPNRVAVVATPPR